MELEPTDLLEFDFKKFSHSLRNHHSVGIGLWAHWWLELYNDKAIVIDSKESVRIDGDKRQADLIFCTPQGKRIGVLEVENSYDSYLDKDE